MTAPEFARPQQIETIGELPRTLSIAADGGERAALAQRFGLVAIDSLTATFAIRRDAAGIVATGRVNASLVQACSVTGDPLSVTIDEPVALRFIEAEVVDGDEIELSADACDSVLYSGKTIDLGEAAAETMALALDPFPRGPRAEAALREAGVLREEEAGPFGALAGLRQKLADQG
ncbi:MAG: hypothetical protein B7Y43_00040 [Sphingomonas sp. 28-62-20]|uniref:YceD family protein n=1 Tax=Sphingomonas sp. 28-62-20 TaxID=1970433 RepID=UPI000BD2393A|nr:MAG: hypothetical protein B7Y43_00040 [Sphingomonas sp. 28-62-20]